MRGGFAYLLPALIAVAAVPLVAQAPAVDKLEELLWQGAVNANSVDAYNVYLRRYPAGTFADLARENVTKLGGTTPPAGAAPAPPPPPPAPVPVAAPVAIPAPPAPVSAPAPAPLPAPVPVAAADPSPLFLCRPVFANGAAPLDKAPEAELSAYLEATRVNTIDLYRRYLEQFPSGAFAPEIRQLVETRTARANAFAASPIPGPLPAKSRRPLAIAADDYPAQAARDRQQGSVSAVWEVAADGCVQACRVTQSSGSAALDAATCRIVTVRGRYDPARDSAGKPNASIDQTVINWTLPQ